MKVFTYFEPIPELDDGGLLPLWSASWAKHGWTPVILDRSIAATHPFFNKFLGVKHLLRTVNPLQYELACYLRWLAVSMSGGGVMADWDVMNYGYIPEQAVPGDKIKLLSIHSPCVAIGTQVAFEKVIQCFLDFERDPHSSGKCEHSVSDQNVLLSTTTYDLDYICHDVFEDHHWVASPLVHYPNAWMTRLRLRSTAIQTLRAP